MSDALNLLIKRVRRVSRTTTALLNAITDMEEELREVCRAVADESTGRLDAAIQCGVLRIARNRREAALRAATTGARTLEMRPAPRDGAFVRIDEGRPFRLSRGDARLLRVLTHGAAPTYDGLPPWRTYDQLGDALKRPTGERPTQRALVESVYRVRRALVAADLNPYLLKVDRRAGRLRFLLRSARRAA
jgi:hypothetical protein